MQILDYRQLLREQLLRRLSGNPRYSQRAFARQLGLSAGELSEVLRGKRRLSERSALRVAQGLELTPGETRRLLLVLQLERAGGAPEASRLLNDGESSDERGAGRPVGEDVFRVVSDWYCFAILNLMDTRGFRPDPRWIARRLGIAGAEAEEGLARLERVGLVRREGRVLRVSPEWVETPDELPSAAVRDYHRQILTKAQHALETIPPARRQIIGTGFALDSAKLPALKRELARVMKKLVDDHAGGRPDEVFQLELALFPLTQENT